MIPNSVEHGPPVPSPLKEQEEKTPPQTGTLGNILSSSVIEHRSVVGVLIILTLYTIYFARDFLLPIFLAMIISGMLQPLVDKMHRYKIPNSVASIMVVLSLVTFMAILLYYISTPALNWLERGPYVFFQIEGKLSNLKESIAEASQTTKKLQQITEITRNESDGVEVIVKGPSLGEQIMEQAQLFIAMAFIVLALIYFLLARGRTMIENFANSFTDPEQGQRICQLLKSIQYEITAYLQTITMINIGLGVVTTIVLYLYGLPTPYLWGVLAGLLNFIPYLGAILTTLIIATVSLLTFDNWLQISLPPLTFILINSTEGQFVTPTILGNRLTLNPVAIFISILFWTWVWGIPGALLAVPSLTTLKIISNYFDSLKLLRALLS